MIAPARGRRRTSRRSAPGIRAGRSDRPSESALRDLQTLGAGDEGAYITPDDLPKFGTHVADVR